MARWGILKDTRLWLLLAAVAMTYGAHRLGFFADVSVETLRDHREDLSEWVEQNFALAVLAYLAVYITAVALSVPCGVILTLSGGFLFGAGLGGPMAVVASTIGAAILFLLARSLLGGLTLERLGPGAARLAEGIRRDAASYLLALRFVPVFPFFLVNLVPAFVGVPLRTYVITTFIGVIPATTVFALAGAGLGSVLDSDEALTARAILTPQLLAGFLMLAGFVLLSIPVRRWLARGQGR